MTIPSITHSIQSNGLYALSCGKFHLGVAKKTDVGFYGTSVFGDQAEHSSMADLKAWLHGIASTMEGLAQHLTAKPTYITVEDARKIGGLSHSQIASRIKELHKFHPYLRGDQYGAAILKEALEAQARWPNMPGSRDAREWLAANAACLPKVRQVDWDHYEQTRRIMYLDR